MFKKDIDKVLHELNSSSNGISEEEASKRLQDGRNELETTKKQGIIIKFLLEFKDVLTLILLASAIISFVIDPEEWIESLIIFIVVILNAVLGVVQESKAEKSLDALKKMSSPKCKVLRDNNAYYIDSELIVKGDIVLFEAGDYIPADLRIIEASNLMVDESALTGESVPVHKETEALKTDSISLGDQINMAFSSTFVTNGRGIGVVCNTGMNTEIGKIAKMLNHDKKEFTPLQIKLSQIGKVIGIMSILICIVVFILEMAAGVSNIKAFKTAIALAVAAIPEGLATVVTIVLSIGVTKMAKKNAIIKKLPAVETLGCTSVVCSDKTGTLTQNKMTVVNCFYKMERDLEDLDINAKEMLSYFALCSDAKISFIDGEMKRIGDPTELALLDVNNIYGLDISNTRRIADLPFDSDRKLMSIVIEKNGKKLLITKGAPDVVFQRSINQDDVIVAQKYNEAKAFYALRMLAVGVKEITDEEINYDIENGLAFLGLVGMIDPAREEVKPAIALAKKAGIKTVMITGDHVITAQAIARNLGILNEGDLAISSEELNKLTDEDLFNNIEHYAVYARVSPTDKVRIVDAWQKKGYVVSMTGDGVNDSPALKKADIGCAMGITGTDVSKEAAAMILVDDNFSTIIEAVYQGRGIYENIKKCVKYLLSSNIGEVLTIFIVSLLGVFTSLNLGVPLLPIHLLWINLITDSLPAFGLGMEDADIEVMNRPPRPKKEGFFANHMGLEIFLGGLMIGGLTLTAFLIGHNESVIIGQTMAFMTLSMAQLFHSFNMKAEHSIFHKNIFENKFLNYAFFIGMGLQLFVLYVPFMSDIFNLKPLDVKYFMLCFVLAFSTIFFVEIYKIIRNAFKKNKQN